MLKPLNDNVVIEPIEVEKKTASGIILTGDAAQPKHTEGIVIAVGPGWLEEDGKRKGVSVEVGQRVIYSDYSQNTISHGGKDLVILSEGTILAIVE
jgi:chaperonin GroES